MNNAIPSARASRLLASLCAVLLLGSALAPPTLAAEAREQGASSGATPARVVDLNTATAQELTAVPGIGPALAQRIVDFREKEGPFRRVEDLMKVKGIGEKSFQKIRAHVKVEPRG